MTESYPRHTAVRVLTRVLSDHLNLDDAIDVTLSEPDAQGSSARPWLTEVCSGTLRWKGRLDLAIDSIALKKKPSGWLRKALLIGAYQLIAQDRTDPGRVVSETVDAIKKQEGEAPARFANALLRKIADHAAEWRSITFDPSASLTEQAQWASQPEWLWKKFCKDMGRQSAVEYAAASLDRPKLWVRARVGLDASEWSAGAVAQSFQRVLAHASDRITEVAPFQAGDLFVQDISSQALVHEVSRLVRERLGTGKLRALDLCAAPGGKSAGLAWNDFEVTATDHDQKRVVLLKETLSRVAPDTRVVEYGRVAELGDFDLVWVDAPCTGTGILRRHPEIRWVRRESELEDLRKVQASLMERGLAATRLGGIFVYSVCSVLSDEGQGRLDRVLKKQADPTSFEVLKTWSLSPSHAPHGDGFWGAAVLKARSV